MSTWSPDTELLAALYDRIGNLIAVQVIRGGGKAPKIDPWPRPETAGRRVAQRRGIARHQSLVDRLTPR
jgi:hypothetical protein